MLTRIVSCTIAALLMPISLAGTARADLIMTIDATNLSATTFTATGGLSTADYSLQGSGIALEDFFGANSTNSFGSLLSGDFRPTASNVRYSSASANGGTTLLRMTPGNQSHSFSVSQSAFSGQTEVDFATLQGITFRTTNFVGDVVIFDDFGNNTGITVGQYSLVVSAVPEPSSFPLLMPIAAGLLTRNRRRLLAS